MLEINNSTLLDRYPSCDYTDMTEFTDDSEGDHRNEINSTVTNKMIKNWVTFLTLNIKINFIIRNF